MTTNTLVQGLLWVVAGVVIFLFLRRRRARRSR